MQFTISDCFTDPGYLDGSRANEDWFSHDGKVVVIADGATGLSDKRLLSDGESDAQAVAKRLCERLCAAPADDPIRDLVSDVINRLKVDISRKDAISDIPRYAWPACGFISARLQAGLIEIAGLGDLPALIGFRDGTVERFCPLGDIHRHESEAARAALERKVGGAEALRSDDVIERLRLARAKANTFDSGVWTVSLEPLAADHVFTVALPTDDIAAVLLMSDGFASAIESYEMGDSAWLMARAKCDGLAAINVEIRRIERLIDPQAKRFPRFKQSDDSTAILAEIAS